MASGNTPELVHPAKWKMGPPAPPWLAYIARGLMLLILILVGHWVQAYLGGVASGPEPTAQGNDTGKLFNWHPILMTMAFAVFMAEAVLTYQAPLISSLSRESRKRVHWVMHSAAALCILFGLIAVFKSHSLKLPVPMADLYSPHSLLGLTVVIMAVAQAVVGVVAYLYPKISLSQRLALGPVHHYFGMAIWVMGLAAMATGLQEKVTFTQLLKPVPKEGLFTGIIRIPAVVEVLLAVLALLVLYFQVPAAKAKNDAGAAELGATARYGGRKAPNEEEEGESGTLLHAPA
mmetsp:Transcript_446/g.904  ORF Transcript_446/g.904 Transcript_446/m.904 type:complete len:290 (-) Transcript_446:378-1247(-)|eukprot:CAMPEP_0202890772 /NCGR_PEP_ID=MMETSP1392-20130828/1078_1 /ASSEMBLY_ACC=CAM_ASM_000868 /TAXON_ID=225041 /ORGANISM="Chlamydomonas chlamydogama, Strain SAG 11-48b" /LENGTH=289 /DNA_ID=CAMNT_0049574409 /DNA_START=12 /DNA_END=881 /DNA_ORIENTATION=-